MRKFQLRLNYSNVEFVNSKILITIWNGLANGHLRKLG